MKEYETGKQPCNNFKPVDYIFNVHECVFCNGDDKGSVSFCTNCSWDHHANGYDTCKNIKPGYLGAGF